ncbi:MAG: transposase [Armatimonadota bacterium]|nr:transposase [bacterium]
MGVTYAGEKEILGFERTPIESESAWRGFISRLVQRGLKKVYDAKHLSGAKDAFRVWEYINVVES